MAIRATAAVTVLGLASQAQAFSFSAGDVDADLYGYVRANFAYDVNEEVADDSASGAFPSIADPSDEVEGHFNASAQQSRVGLKASHESGVMVHFEGDFFGGDFRLRHAYGTYNGILAGQTWSNFNSFVGVTPSVDFSGAAGLAGLQGRAPQLRYTTGNLSVALEEDQGSISGFTETTSSYVIDSTGTPVLDTESTEKDTLPLATVRYEGSADAVSYSVAGLVKQNEYDDGTNDDSTVGYGVFGAGKVKLTDMISLQGSVTYTDGANKYNFRSGASDAQADPNDADELENISSVGGVLGATFGLGQGRSINIQHGMVQNDVDSDNATETNQTTFVNYMWKPADNVTMGAEYQYWKAEQKDGDSDDANRVMFMAQYNF